MGIENRDYVREDNNGSGFGSQIGAEFPAVRNIILITVLVYLAQMFMTAPAGSLEPMSGPQISKPEQWLQLDTVKVVEQGQVWRLLTSAFCHDRFSVMHILINMFFLFWFGRGLESIYGSRRFTWFYITAAIISSVAFVAVQMMTGERIPAIGASGAVMAVFAVYATFYPREQINLFFVIPVQIRFLLMLYVVYDVHPVLLKLAGSPVATGVAHVAHLGGLAYGFLFYRTGWSLLSLWNRLPVPGRNQPSVPQSKKAGRSRPDRRSSANVNQTSEKMDREVDRILEKISVSGQDSLTKKEREKLDHASKKYSERSSE